MICLIVLKLKSVSLLLLVNCLMYADDIVLLSNSKEGLQNSLFNLKEFCDSWNLKINIEKTKIIIFNRSSKLLKNYRQFSI